MAPLPPASDAYVHVHVSTSILLRTHVRTYYPHVAFAVSVSLLYLSPSLMQEWCLSSTQENTEEVGGGSNAFMLAEFQ